MLSQAGLRTTLPDVDPQDPAYGARLTEHLRDVASDALFREAVHVSSPHLGNVLSEALSGRTLSTKRAEKASLSTLRYLIRMGHRPTPFGIMAGVTLGNFADQTRARIGTRHRKQVRADAGWVWEVVTRALEDRSARYRVGVAWNNLCTLRGDRLLLPYTPKPNSEGGTASKPREVSIRFTPAVATVRDVAKRSIRYGELVETLQAAHPEASAETIDKMLHSLVKNRILVTEFQPGHSPDDQLGRLVNLLGPAAAGDLSQVTTHLERYEDAELIDAEFREEATRAMRAVHTGTESVLQVDLRLDAEIAISRTVAQEAERAATALWRMSPRIQYGHHKDYFNAFLERYGSDTAVPILDLLDPHAGIGAPATYAWPATGSREHSHEPSRSSFGRSRQKLLAELVQDCLVTGTSELALDDQLVDRLSYPDDEGASKSLDFCVQVLAPSTTAVDRGDFKLMLSPAAGSDRAGKVMGRFANMLGSTSELRHLLTNEPAAEDVIVADLDFEPAEARLRNVIRTPRITGKSIPVGTYPPEGETVIDLADIAVEVHGERLRMVCSLTGTPVKVVVPHMLNLSIAGPNVARLMAELSEDSTQPWQRWDWGELDNFPYLPRVTYGRTILHPARWLVPDALTDDGMSFSDWRRELRQWQKRRNVPDRIRVVVTDRYLDLDIRDHLHCKLLRSELRGQSGVQLFESIPTEEDFGWVGGHANELVISLKRSGTTTSLESRNREASAPVLIRHGASAVQPGGEWVHLKVYGSKASQDRLIASYLPRLLSTCQGDVDRWFFIRYADPDSHLRVRLHGKPEAVRTRVTEAVHSWSSELVSQRLARNTCFDAYLPEEDRYGGTELMTVAEEFFQADSEIVLSQLQAGAAGRLPLDRGALAAANFLRLLQSFGEWDWNSWITTALPKTSVPRSLLPPPAQLSLLDPGGKWAELMSAEGGASLSAGWERWSTPATVYGKSLVSSGRPTPLGTRVLRSLLHMHFNRLNGINREAENRACAVLRNAAWSHLERNR
ncbi:lantibiotic dehydratase [Streptomyces anandii]|uniref:lantibiotic dehydratase n=1 Tax=Streptomyces anandii TaxID=285454 RepID=UPI0036C25DD9